MLRSLVEHLTTEGIMEFLVIFPSWEREQYERCHADGDTGIVAFEIASRPEAGASLPHAARALHARASAARVGSQHGVVVSSSPGEGIVVQVPTSEVAVQQRFCPTVRLAFGEPHQSDDHFCPRFQM